MWRSIVGSRWRHNCCHWTLSERTLHRQSNNAIWDLRHDLRRDSIESRWFSFVNTTWLGPGPSLKWHSVRVQAKSWVKSQVKTVSEYGPWCLCSGNLSMLYACCNWISHTFCLDISSPEIIQSALSSVLSLSQKNLSFRWYSKKNICEM